ncbi:MAG: DUF427 domain-containing protein [Ilumatobacteraceae bacterium]
MRPQRIEPGPGQESVWDYPRPPAVVPYVGRVRIVHGGQVLADTTAAMRVLETSQPPAFYLPPGDVEMGRLSATTTTTWCEWKGAATYWRVDNSDEVAWSYLRPTAGFEGITRHLAFYAQRVDECWVDDELVLPNPGNFYGGWITSRVVGPFKGAPGTLGW